MTKPTSGKKTAAAVPPKPKPALETTKDTQQQSNPASATIEVAAVEVPELTEDEQRDRLHLERKVEHAFYEAGKALTELRDRRLYRSTHKTFEEYCKDRFGFERRHPYRLIEAAQVVDNLKKMCPNWTQNEFEDNGATVQSGQTQILPASEGQVRPLTKLEAQEQQQVWQQAVEQVGGKVPSGRVVKDIVDRIRERTKIPNPYRVGEICVFLPKDNPDLRGKGGCWGVVSHVGDYSCTVETWDGDYTVKIEHLKSLELLDDDCKFIQQLCLRLRQLHTVADHDPAVDWLLQGLGKQAKPYLSALQAKLLAAVEREYKLSWKQHR
ncbi:hypothetical protein [Nostoc sp. ChiQUE01b]|uniref:hypothetical protein n=1 Tax=Nostoc sp. ChiQUE01b TaxID=3075376 RepID=UPI002AD3C431|nr:hypothetical protein [Nostoc sp. ChiQUE01b]MDZ8241832.1 hypothetical protein [Nostoc sp. ChiQUE01a]MDZ8264608.1 hypothetical protein [Nostoc sp. ChiQUE01b]